MPVYAKSVKSTDPRFRGRVITVGAPSIPTATIPIPDDTVLCNGCNQNITEGYLIYLGERELKADQPYDIYCESCMKKYFPKAIRVWEEH